mmetsp:Transcript_37722/g.103670  ORF Transcript_37722/g.103670 Transcript_37722/m.103670 type:complete len:97 (-) Transcript_37722:12-302(-)
MGCIRTPWGARRIVGSSTITRRWTSQGPRWDGAAAPDQWISTMGLRRTLVMPGTREGRTDQAAAVPEAAAVCQTGPCTKTCRGTALATTARIRAKI